MRPIRVLCNRIFKKPVIRNGFFIIEIVERNFEIVTKNKVNATTVQDGDTIEIIRLVGGG